MQLRCIVTQPRPGPQQGKSSQTNSGGAAHASRTHTTPPALHIMPRQRVRTHYRTYWLSAEGAQASP